MEHGLKTDSVFLLSDGLIEGIIAPLLPVLAGSSALELRELLESSFNHVNQWLYSDSYLT